MKDWLCGEVNLMQKCLQPAFFLMASRRKLLWLQKAVYDPICGKMALLLF